MNKQIVVNGLLTSYSQSGKGKDVLLLHGWGDSKETYAGLAKQISSKFKATAVDLPGFGKTQPPETAWGLSDYSDFLAEFTKKAKIKPGAVIGHSNGGALAIVALAEGKLVTDKLILLAASGVRDKDGLKRALYKIIAKTGKFVTFWLPASIRRGLQKRFYGTIGSDMMVAPHLKETFKRTVRQDIQKEASKLSLPVLMLYGSQDKATPVDGVGRPLHALINKSKLEIIGGAGHFVHHDELSEVSTQVMRFLK